MAKIPKQIGKGEGGRGLQELAKVLEGEVNDLNELRNTLIALLQKLDADAGTASDYESSLTPAQLETTKE